jgi:DNA-binding NtrC family response regulator
VLEEAEFALANEDIGVAIARFETLLSMVHKFLLAHIPTGRTREVRVDSHFVQPPEVDPQKASVLIVDDEPNILYALCETFRSIDFQCYSANSPRDAMRALVDRDFDLIVTDLLMPYMDGREFILAAKKCGSRAKTIVVTVRSRMADSGEIGSEAFPADGYLIKPFHMKELFDIVDRVLKRDRTKNEEAPT